MFKLFCHLLVPFYINFATEKLKTTADQTFRCKFPYLKILLLSFLLCEKHSSNKMCKNNYLRLTVKHHIYLFRKQLLDLHDGWRKSEYGWDHWFCRDVTVLMEPKLNDFASEAFGGTVIRIKLGPITLSFLWFFLFFHI